MGTVRCLLRGSDAEAYTPWEEVLVLNRRVRVTAIVPSDTCTGLYLSKQQSRGALGWGCAPPWRRSSRA